MADDNLSPGVKKTDEPETLELPRMVAGGLAVYFGPGIILMMTGIGTSHLITAPVAGGRFEFALLWCIPVAYIFKYYGFEMAFRFTHATGRSMLDAYATAWKKWPLVCLDHHLDSDGHWAGRKAYRCRCRHVLFPE